MPCAGARAPPLDSRDLCCLPQDSEHCIRIGNAAQYTKRGSMTSFQKGRTTSMRHSSPLGGAIDTGLTATGAIGIGRRDKRPCGLGPYGGPRLFGTTRRPASGVFVAGDLAFVAGRPRFGLGLVGTTRFVAGRPRFGLGLVGTTRRSDLLP